MPTKDPKTLLVLQIRFAASPHRVEEAARLLARALEAADPDLAQDSVTMVVHNFDMRVELRAQKPAGRRAVMEVSEVMSNPLTTVQRRPLSKHIAEAFAKESKGLVALKPEIFVPGQSKPIATIDADFVRVMESAAQYEPAERDILMGTSEAYGRVLRIGRKDEGHGLSVRVRIEGIARDLAVASDLDPDQLKLLFDAARDDKLVRLQTRVRWLRDGEKAWAVDGRSATVTGARAFEVASGAEFADAALKEIEPRTDEEIADIISDLERR
jgi:hypothetical protein